jgi:hypothetical protein
MSLLSHNLLSPFRGIWKYRASCNTLLILNLKIDVAALERIQPVPEYGTDAEGLAERHVWGINQPGVCVWPLIGPFFLRCCWSVER